MERTLASSADAEIILKLYELRREAVMREARAWVLGEFWPSTAEEFFVVAANTSDPHNAWYRQVITYWEMAAALVLHGAVSADLFVDCNGEGFFLLAKFTHLIAPIRERTPGFLMKTSELVSRFASAAARYEIALKSVENRTRSLQSGKPSAR
ncbi:MAG: hypothetical protein WBD67_02250 [Terracidiphilus sp.]